MWFWKFRTNVAPFAGFMLKGYEKRRPLERADPELDEQAKKGEALATAPQQD